MLKIPDSHIHQCVMPTVSKILCECSECSVSPPLGSQASPGNTPRHSFGSTQLSGALGCEAPASPRAKGGLSLGFQGIHQTPAWLPWGISQVTGTQVTPLWNSPSFNTSTTTQHKPPCRHCGSEHLPVQKAIWDPKELSSLESKCLYSC